MINHQSIPASLESHERSYFAMNPRKRHSSSRVIVQENLALSPPAPEIHGILNHFYSSFASAWFQHLINTLKSPAVWKWTADLSSTCGRANFFIKTIRWLRSLGVELQAFCRKNENEYRNGCCSNKSEDCDSICSDIILLAFSDSVLHSDSNEMLIENKIGKFYQ